MQAEKNQGKNTDDRIIFTAKEKEGNAGRLGNGISTLNLVGNEDVTHFLDRNTIIVNTSSDNVAPNCDEVLTQETVTPRANKDISWVQINVAGVKYRCHKQTMLKFPGTLLSDLNETSNYFDPINKEYAFDRNPIPFQFILDFYRNGELHFPNYMCGPYIEKELEFWKIKDINISACCWTKYVQFSETRETLDKIGNSFNVIDTFDDTKADLESDNFVTKLRRFREKAWYFLEDPTSSTAAQVKAMVYMLMILASILSFAVDTHPAFRIPAEPNRLMNRNETNPKILLRDTTNSNQAIYIGEFIITCCFAFDLLSRFIVCPSKIIFLKSWFNILDMVVVFSQWATMGIALQDHFWENKMLQRAYVAFSTFRMCRIFLVFKLARHYTGLRVLLLALKSSFREMALLLMFLIIGMITFATLIYYAEFHEADQYQDIPTAFWWALITMTTVGYGDVYPITNYGYAVGAGCAIMGMLATGLPIPIIANNFTLYYSVSKLKDQMDKRDKKKENEALKELGKVMANKTSKIMKKITLGKLTKQFRTESRRESTETVSTYL